MLLEEGFDIFSKGYIVVCLVVWGIAVVSCINGIYGTGELARKDTGGMLVPVRAHSNFETHLLTLWLFLLLPKRPCIITIGSPFACPLLS